MKITSRAYWNAVATMDGMKHNGKLKGHLDRPSETVLTWLSSNIMQA